MYPVTFVADPRIRVMTDLWAADKWKVAQRLLAFGVRGPFEIIPADVLQGAYLAMDEAGAYHRVNLKTGAVVANTSATRRECAQFRQWELNYPWGRRDEVEPTYETTAEP